VGTFTATPAIVASERGYPSLYRPRNPRASPLFLLVEARYEELKALWEDRFEKTHGFWRGFTDTADTSHTLAKDDEKPPSSAQRQALRRRWRDLIRRVLET